VLFQCIGKNFNSPTVASILDGHFVLYLFISSSPVTTISIILATKPNAIVSQVFSTLTVGLYYPS